MEEQEPDKRRHWLISSLIAITSALGGAIVYGIIGNRADSIFVSLLANIRLSLSANAWPWILSLSILLISTGMIYYLLLYNRALKHTFDINRSEIEIDGSLLRLLASWISSQNKEEEMKRMLMHLLHNVMANFHGDVYRASILLPDQQGEYLKIWTHHGMSQDTVDQVKFYIGTNPDRITEQGIAGQVFLDGTLRLAHMKQLKNGTWICDCAGFMQPRNQHLRHYKSFICVPIMGIASGGGARGHTTTCLGVVCFDSFHHKTFDHPDLHKSLRLYADRIASALAMRNILP